MQRTRVVFVLCLLVPCVLGEIVDLSSVQTEATIEDVVRKLDLMDKGMREMVSSVIQQILPMAVRSSSEIEISPECQGSLMKMVMDLKQMKEWSLKMLDATAKIPVGFMSGNTAEWGHYDQCLDVANYDETTKKLLLQGQYCIVEFRPPLPPKPKDLRFFQMIKPFDNYTSDNYAMKEFVKKASLTYVTGFVMAVCVPSTCSKNDIQNLATYVAGKVQSYADVMSCEIKKPLQIDALQYTLIGIFATFVVLCILGTAVDILQNQVNEDKQISAFRSIVKSFSAKTNVKLLLKVDASNDSNLQCIHGLRFFSILWVIIGHTYIFSPFFRNRNFIAVESWFKGVPIQLLMGASVSMETFFCIGGTVASYTAINSFSKKTFNRSIPITMIRRIWRLLPGVLMIIAMGILFPLIGSGPAWNMTIGKAGQNCRKSWLCNVLFINNFCDPLESCWGHLWYIAMDTQFYILALISLSIFFKKSIWAVGVSIVMICSSIIITPIVTYWKELDPTAMAGAASVDEFKRFNKYIYWMPYSHLASYFIGLITGVLIIKKRNMKISLVWQIIGWIFSTTMCMVLLLSPAKWVKGEIPTLWESMLYSGFHRPLWALSIAWIIVACVNGYGGIINSILSFKGIIPLSRLTFQVYLLHVLVLFYYYSNMRDGLFYSHITLVWIFFGTAVGTYIAAFAAHIFYDGPVSNLGRILIAKMTPSKRESTNSSIPKEITSFGDSEKNHDYSFENGHTGTNGVYIKRF